MTVPDVIPAIFGATKNSRMRTSMAFGSDLESGWSDTAFNPSSATGPYQILLTAHPGVTTAEAEDPVWATNYMLPAYTSAVAQVSDTTWNQNPELASEQAVILAEAPGGPYPTSAVGPYGGEGTDVVNADWQNTANTLVGKWKPGNDITLPPPSTQTAELTSANSGAVPSSLWEAILGGPTSILSYLAQQAAKKSLNITEAGNAGGILGNIYNALSNPVDILERGALIVFGAVIIIVGLIVLAQGSKSVRSLEGAAVRGTGSRISMGVSGGAADRERRQNLAAEANKIGERKLALKERREARLATRSNVQKPAVGRHRKTEGQAA